MDFKILFTISLLLYIVSCKPISDNKNLQDIYNELNVAEKHFFVDYFLTKGYMQNHPNTLNPYVLRRRINIEPKNLTEKIQNLQVPKNYAITFFNRVMTKYNLSETQVLRLSRGEIICLPSGECIDTGDAGNVCCT